ncbi:MAG: hypothetical protein M0D57_13860 [Sphingobacteriales bacterium JAD_PAG50586_3]|nr:MAG: hypothetical protein M0D57_13860 [Sphingobacteriales bacterium JAD_PAG50586_3]
MIAKDIEILKRQIEALKFNYTDEALRFYFLLGKLDNEEYYNEYSIVDFVKANKFFVDLVKANAKVNKYNQQALINYLYVKWWLFFITIKKYDFKIYKHVLYSPFYNKLNLVTKVKFFLNVLLIEKHCNETCIYYNMP